MISHRAAGIAVLIAFIVGLLASLSLRPTGGHSAVGPVAAEDDSVVRRLHWRVPISITSTSPILGETPLWWSEMVSDATGGAIQLDIFDPGELVPAFGITDAVRDNKVPAGHVWLGYDQGKIPVSSLFAATPFGLEPWEYMGWWYYGGGLELADDIYAKHNIKPLLCGVIGPETAGWFRQPVNSLSDIQGLKIRFAGLGGKVMERAGASVTMLPGGEIFQALEKGAIDATEFSLPVMDRALGFARVAKHNYYPGWHQTFTATHAVINLDVWQNLPEIDQHQLTQGCMAASTRSLAASEGMQGEVIAGFPALGVEAKSFNDEILRELRRITGEVLAEEAAVDEDFARVLASQEAFRAQYLPWKRLGYLPRDF